MEQNQQVAYDRGATIFSPDGRLYQVEYAREAVKRGTSSVGIETADGVVLAAARRIHSPLIKEKSIEKINPLDEHVAVASAGHVADSRKLVEIGRLKAQRHRVEFDESISVEELTKVLMEEVQEYTQTGGARPFGVAMLVGGVSNGEPHLFETDPSGTSYEWRATAIGRGNDKARSHLEETYHDDLGLDAAIDLALETLAMTADDIEPKNVDVATVTTADATTHRLSDSRLENHIAELDLEE